jgi:signal transduction histidine kinase
MNPQAIYQKYQELQQYVGWTEQDAWNVRSLAHLVESFLPDLIDDFYDEIERHPGARRVITGGRQQVERLKETLRDWLRELFSGKYEEDYVIRRWRVGWRHVEIGLDQVYTNVALSRFRRGLFAALDRCDLGPDADVLAIRRSLTTLLDLDLAIIEDAYQTEYLARQQRVERLAAIGQVAGGIAHELRNPLNVIKTSVYYLLNARNANPAKAAEHMQRIERQVGACDGVITALSNFAKLPLPDLRPFAIEPSLREILELYSLPENITVEVDLPPTLPKALADSHQLRIVFANLIRNAREAMPQGGQLSLLGSSKDGHVEVAIVDTGVGIAPEHLPHISEPLYSTKARGLGLGLAIVRAILEKNQGTLRVTSQPGQGSTFTVRLLASVEEQKGEPGA